MVKLLEKDISYGAWGLSLGLGYIPSILSDKRLGEILLKSIG